MLDDITITHVRFSQGDEEQLRTGLMGWITCTLNGTVILDGIALRRSREGHRYLAFPARKGSSGNLHHYVRPSHADARQEIERQIFSALGLERRGREAC